MKKSWKQKLVTLSIFILVAVILNACALDESSVNKEDLSALNPSEANETGQTDPKTVADEKQVEALENAEETDEKAVETKPGTVEEEKTEEDVSVTDTDDSGITSVETADSITDEEAEGAIEERTEAVMDKDGYVNAKINALINSDEYKSASKQQRDALALALLEELKQDGYIKEYSLDSLGNLYSFIYSSGLRGGIYLKDFKTPPGGLAMN